MGRKYFNAGRGENAQGSSREEGEKKPEIPWKTANCRILGELKSYRKGEAESKRTVVTVGPDLGP